MKPNGSISEAGHFSGQPAPAINNALQSNGSAAMAKLPPELVRALNAPMPVEALKPHPTKEYLSSVKAIYVVERLNDVFGLGGWTYRSEVVEAGQPTQVATSTGGLKEKAGMIVMHVVLRVPEYGIRLEQYGGSDNADRGDAYKGAVTDALTKIASYMGIAMDVYKGAGPTKQNPRGLAIAGTQAAADRVASDKIAAGQGGQQQPREPQPAPWTNRGTMRAAFGRVEKRLSEEVYLEALTRYGATPELRWRDSATALKCYEELIEKAVA